MRNCDCFQTISIESSSFRERRANPNVTTLSRPEENNPKSADNAETAVCDKTDCFHLLRSIPNCHMGSSCMCP